MAGKTSWKTPNTEARDSREYDRTSYLIFVSVFQRLLAFPFFVSPDVQRSSTVVIGCLNTVWKSYLGNADKSLIGR
jgi:hypothetical protein